ncbi:hypothetical protein EJ08DRAFT_728712 [Tothia fuscella]|uniref:MICOS complex subunit MIC60 n=1 Tax=Tothia fuscella TaxID=1048955 RepID=A0A9P4P5B6_9PEZI|nr:hypothetical protein EJ08DRAFT_728712 [Tothia fuscella]
MLRVTLSRSRILLARPAAARAQWLAPSRTAFQQRYFADRKTEETLVPGSQSLKQPYGGVPPVPGVAKSASSTVDTNTPAKNIPILPPKPEDLSDVSKQTLTPPTTVPTGTGTASVAPPAGPTNPPKKSRKMRKFLAYLLVLSALGYGGGVYYALVSDNWHDFFTEYVPFGEDAVGYFEERAFKKRSQGRPPALPRLHEQVRGEEKVRIPSNAGVSSRPAEKADLGGKGPHVSAVDDNVPKPKPAVEKGAAPVTGQEKKNQAPAKPEESSSSHKLLPKQDGKQESSPAATPSAKKEEPRPAAPAPAPAPVQTPLVDHINIENASEPVVQDVVKILNDLITVINADGAAGKYSSTIESAKDNLKKVIGDINTLKATEQKNAEDKIKQLHAEFDGAAKQLLQRHEDSIQNQEVRWKEEFEAEQKLIKEAYEQKLKTELDSVNKVYDQKLKNELLEQAIALRRDFTTSVQNQVETERGGRLSKLGELSSSVAELEKLTGEWNNVVDTNLQTQHLLVAVEAVRSTLENSTSPTPFIEELAALKEVASNDPVVSAAIASINPKAYQIGIPTYAQLIDRFRRVATEVRKAALLPENAGVASHVASFLLSKVMFRKEGLPVGDDVESVLARTEVLLEEGDLDGAAREMNGLGGWSKTLARDWLGECRKVLEVQQALDVIATEARLQSLLVD